MLEPKMPELKKYRSHKEVEAGEMTLQEFREFKGENVFPDRDGEERGMLIVYKDGYQSWSPMQPFVEGYTEIGDRVEFDKIKRLKSKVVYEYFSSHTETYCKASIDGFVIARGFSACVDPKNFNEQIGKDIAKKNCDVELDRALWQFEGYKLKFPK